MALADFLRSATWTKISGSLQKLRVEEGDAAAVGRFQPAGAGRPSPGSCGPVVADALLRLFAGVVLSIRRSTDAGEQDEKDVRSRVQRLPGQDET
jgi:hypothetical protein